MSSSGTAITVSVNDKAESILPGTSVASLLEQLQIRNRAVAVEIDGELVPREAFAITQIDEGARIEIVTIAGGG